ncbi:MAG: polyphosphate polymerase domain-containing protein [Anaerofustis sp.]
MALTTFQRSEMKFILNENQFQILRARLDQYMKPDEYCKCGKDYAVYNLYYDTQDNYLIRSSLQKPKYKEKIRLRSYKYPIFPHDEVFLELKKKSMQTVFKRRAILTLREAYDYLEMGIRPKCDTYMNRQVMNEIDYFLSLHPVKPASCITYRRMAFFGRYDKDFRITFDYDLRSRRKNLRLECGSFGDALLNEGQYLMEVKISGAVPKWLADTLADMGLYRQSFSKYGREYTRYRMSDTHMGSDGFVGDAAIACSDYHS